MRSFLIAGSLILLSACTSDMIDLYDAQVRIAVVNSYPNEQFRAVRVKVFNNTDYPIRELTCSFESWRGGVMLAKFQRTLVDDDELGSGEELVVAFNLPAGEGYYSSSEYVCRYRTDGPMRRVIGLLKF